MFQSDTECYRVLQSVAECYRVSQSATECYGVLQSITEFYRVYRVLQGITKYYRVLQSITKYYKDKSSASTWTNFWACFCKTIFITRPTQLAELFRSEIDPELFSYNAYDKFFVTLGNG